MKKGKHNTTTGTSNSAIDVRIPVEYICGESALSKCHLREQEGERGSEATFLCVVRSTGALVE